VRKSGAFSIQRKSNGPDHQATPDAGEGRNGNLRKGEASYTLATLLSGWALRGRTLSDGQYWHDLTLP